MIHQREVQFILKHRELLPTLIQRKINPYPPLPSALQDIAANDKNLSNEQTFSPPSEHIDHPIDANVFCIGGLQVGTIDDATQQDPRAAAYRCRSYLPGDTQNGAENQLNAVLEPSI